MIPFIVGIFYGQWAKKENFFIKQYCSCRPLVYNFVYMIDIVLNAVEFC